MEAKADFPLYQENHAALDLALSMMTQIRTAGLSGRIIGFDYTVVPFVAGQIGIPQAVLPETLKRLMVVEDELYAAPRYIN